MLQCNIRRIRQAGGIARTGGAEKCEGNYFNTPSDPRWLYKILLEPGLDG